jgi:hypothetical protein
MGGLGKHISARDREYFEDHGEWFPESDPESEDESMRDKKDVLKIAITKFKNSKKTKASYMNLFIAVHNSLRQGDGLVWSDVDKILEDVLD